MRRVNFFQLAAVLFIVISLIGVLHCSKSGGIDEASAKQLAQAMELYRNRRFAQTEKVLRAVRSANPDHLETEVLLARTLFFSKRFAEAENTLRATLKAHPRNPYASLWLARVLMVRKDRLNEAITVLRGVLSRDPENLRAHYYLGRCMEAGNQPQAALVAYRRALSMEAQVSRVHLHSARLLYSLKLPGRAQQHASRVTQLDSSVRDVKEAQRLLATRNPEPRPK